MKSLGLKIGLAVSLIAVVGTYAAHAVSQYYSITYYSGPEMVTRVGEEAVLCDGRFYFNGSRTPYYEYVDLTQDCDGF